jgi:PAS domain S-box-containing protein
MSNNKLRVLLAEDSEDDAVLIKRELKKSGFNPAIERVETSKSMSNALKDKKWDIIISDYVMPSFSGIDALKLCKKKNIDLPFIVVSGKIGEDTAVEAMKAGATDYIMKSNLSRLGPAIKRELKDYKIRLERKKAKKELKKSLEEIEKANKLLQNEINERKKVEKQAVEAKEHFQNVIDSTDEIIISLDGNNRISTWNNSAEDVTGYKRKEVLNRTISKLPLFRDSQNVTDVIKNVSKGKKTGIDDLVIITKNNAKKIIRFKGSVLKGKSNQRIGVIFVGEDITKDIEIHGKLVDGNSYLFPDKNIDSAIDLFVDLVRTNYDGLFITRSNPEMVKSMVPPSSKIDVVLFSHEKLAGFKNISDVKTLVQHIKDFTNKHKKPLILLDGLHYLITKFSFETFVDALYQINEIVAKNHSIMFIRFDPSIVDENKMAIIENELHKLPSQKIEGITLADSVYDMLKFIYEQNQNNALVPYKKVMSRFKIAYSTAAKRLEELENKGLIFTKRQGKLRTVYISEKGKTLLHKRETA